MACIDVIIPMYNSEQYIDGLIRTLEGQTFRDFRGVFVDDGSKDRTAELLREKLEKVSFAYRIIRQENKGLPGARNTGIRNLDAEWMVFVDSDDGLDPHYLEFLHRAVTESRTDVGVCGYQIVASEAEVRGIAAGEYSAKTLTSVECIREYYRRWFGAWALILRRSWLAEQALLFDEACTYLEDVPFITQVIVAADRVAVTENPVYLYYQRPGSLMHTPKLEKYQIALDGFARMEEKLRKVSSESCREFFSMGRARYYLATLRKGAVLMPYGQFRRLCGMVPLEKEQAQFRYLQPRQRLAGYVYLVSKRLFYYAMRLMTG